MSNDLAEKSSSQSDVTIAFFFKSIKDSLEKLDNPVMAVDLVLW